MILCFFLLVAGFVVLFGAIQDSNWQVVIIAGFWIVIVSSIVVGRLTGSENRNSSFWTGGGCSGCGGCGGDGCGGCGGCGD